MQTSLDPKWETLIDLTEVDTILRTCVHCGFCTRDVPPISCLAMKMIVLADAFI